MQQQRQLGPIAGSAFSLLCFVLVAATGCDSLATGPANEALELTLSAGHLNLTEGDTAQLRATVGGSTFSQRSPVILWSSSKPAVVRVDTSGRLAAQTVGTAVVTASVGSARASATVAVAPRPIASVRIAPAAVDLEVAGSAQLMATAHDATGAHLPNRPITWWSSDNQIATVAGNGYVTALAPGAATLTASIEGVRSEASVSVRTVSVASVEIYPSSLTIETNQDGRLTAIARAADGRVLSNRTVTWSVSDNVVASVRDGLVTATNVGETSITAVVEGVSASAKLVVVARVVTSVQVTPTALTLQQGKTGQLGATLRAADGTALTDRAVHWTSSDTSVAAVDPNGLVQALAAGKAIVTAVAGRASGLSTITVTPRTVESITVSPPSASLVTGQTLQLQATPRAAGGTPLSGYAIGWSSSNPAVASVSSSGLVQAVGSGIATISASAGGKAGTATIQVSSPPVQPTPVASVSLTPSQGSLSVGGILQLTAVVRAADGSELSGRIITWSSSSPAVATVTTNGLVEGIAPGSPTITATSEGKSATAAVQITTSGKTPVATVAVSPGSANLQIGNTQQLQATTKAADGTVLTGRTITWSTDNAAGATVSGSGLVRAVAAGTAKITARSEGIPGEATVHVTSSASPPSVVDVRTFGARGDGTTDDTQAFAAAIAALPQTGGTLRIPAGNYIITPPSTASPKRGIDLSNRSGISLLGDGVSLSTIKLASAAYRGDTHLVFLEASNRISFKDLTFDGNHRAASFNDEQTHCVDVWWSRFVIFERVRFYDCNSDGLRLLGKSDGTAWTDSVTVINSIFDSNHRSGIAVQRSTRKIRIVDNTFVGTSDQDIDFEPTGLDTAQTNLPEDYVIEGNVITHSTHAHSVTLAGRRITFARNTIHGGAVFVPRADSLVIAGNTILGPAGRQPLELDKDVDRAWIVDNVIADRRTDPHIGSPGAVIVEARARSGIRPTNVVISRNSILAFTNGVSITDAEHVTVTNNVITGRGDGAGIRTALNLITGTPRRGLRIEHNEIRNFAVGVHLSTRGETFTDVRITDNLFEDTQAVPTQTIGILFAGTEPYHAFAVVALNTYARGILSSVVQR